MFLPLYDANMADKDEQLTTSNFCDVAISLITYNMHGYNQGLPVIKDFTENKRPDVLLLQEHWLTPANMGKFRKNVPGYQAFGVSGRFRTAPDGF